MIRFRENQSPIDHLEELVSNQDRAYITGRSESPIEFEFLWALQKVIGDPVDIQRQYKVDTPFATYRLDLRLVDSSSGRAIGIECDGKEFHSPERDSIRDKRIIQSGLVSLSLIHI